MSQEEIQGASKRLQSARGRHETALAQADYDRALTRHQTQEFAKVLEASNREAMQAADRATKEADRQAERRARNEQYQAQREAKLASMTPAERARFIEDEGEANAAFGLYVLGPLFVFVLGWLLYHFGVAGLIKAINGWSDFGPIGYVLVVVFYAGVFVVSIVALVLIFKLGALLIRIGLVKIVGIAFLGYGVVLALPEFTDGLPKLKSLTASAVGKFVQANQDDSVTTQVTGTAVVSAPERADSNSKQASGLHQADRLNSRFGTLAVKRVTDVERQLLIGARSTGIEAYSVAIEGKWSLGERDVVLVSTSEGGTACPATYSFVTLERSSASVSESFGNCSDIPDVSLVGNRVVMKFPEMSASSPAEVIEYEAGTTYAGGKALKSKAVSTQ